MSDNLTFEEGLLKEHPAEPLEGYQVVVFERVGESGERFHSILAPGADPPKPRGWFKTPAHLFASAVEAARTRHLHWSVHVPLNDHVNAFELVLDLDYVVSDARRLAVARNADPLGRVRERVGAVLSADAARLRWAVVVDDFAAEEEELAARNLPALDAFARDYGITLLSLRLTESLPDAATSRERKRAEAERKIAEAEIEADLKIGTSAATERVTKEKNASEQRIHEDQLTAKLGMAALVQRLEAAGRNRKVQDGMVDALVGALGGVARGITSPDELRAAVEAAFALVAGIPLAAEDGSTALPRGNGHPVMLPARAAGGLGGLLDEMLAATAEIDGFSQQRLLRSAILHLIAAALAHGIDGDSGAAGWAETVKKRIAGLDPQPGGSQLETLNRLADPRHLRGLLS